LQTDSKVIVGQIEKEYIARDGTFKRYLVLVWRMENYFKGFSVEHIEGAKNTEADEMVKAVARKTTLPTDVFFQTLQDSSLKIVEPEPRIGNVIQGEDWEEPIIAYLHHHYELDNNTELLKIKQRAKAYQVTGNELYKNSVKGPLLRCLSKVEGKELLAEIHSCVCRGHIGPRALIVKVFRQGFYWSLIIDDTSKVVATCESCQKFSPNSKAPSQPSQLITPLWPLQRWGIDIVGPLTNAHVNYKYTVFTVEYFTKWIEVPRKITVDNTKQFDCHISKDFFHQMGVEAAFASIYHPQSNGVVERANALIFSAIKKILEV
jgi:hypothetical protein